MKQFLNVKVCGFLRYLWFGSCVLPWLGACSYITHNPNAPLLIPFSVANAGSSVSSELVITKRQRYAIILRYFFQEGDEFDREKVRNLAGGSFYDDSRHLVERGAPLMIHVRIVQVDKGDERSLLDTKVSTPHISSHGADQFDAELADIVLEPGHYQLTAENLINAPQFQGAKTYLAVTRAYRGK